jgi:hypothetical protein
MKKSQCNSELALLERKRAIHHRAMLNSKNDKEFQEHQSNYWAILVKIKRQKQLIEQSYYQGRKPMLPEATLPMQSLLKNPLNYK